MNQKSSSIHLIDADFFALAMPAVGEPEALPRHLSDCDRCAHSLQEWKVAVRALAEEEVGPINRRSPEEWSAGADATMARIHRAAKPGRNRQPLRWAIGVAASLLLLVLAIPRHGAPVPTHMPVVAAASAADASGLSAADREDDRLLRDVEFLAQGEDTGTGLVTEENL